MTKAEFYKVIEKLDQYPAEVTRLVSNLSDSEVCHRANPSDFSLLENVCHLRDIDSEGYSVRIDRILNEDRPFLPDLDGGRLAVERKYMSQNLEDALRAFTAARLKIVELLRSIQPEKLEREGSLDGVGVVTLGRLLLLMREHDESHWQDMCEIVSGMRGESVDALSANL